MRNRVPTRPGRVLITPEDGRPAFYATVERADEPRELGDPMDKATFLQDYTAGLYGEGPDAVPDTVFQIIAQSMFGTAEDICRWLRTKRVYSLAQSELQTGKYEVCSGTGPNSTVCIHYASSYAINGSGQFILNDPTSIYVSYNDPYKYEDVLKGKYFVIHSSSFDDAPVSSILLGDESISFSSNKDSDGDYYVGFRGYFRLTQPHEDISEIVTSLDPAAYPVVGDGWNYESLTAVPASRGYPKIAVGNYIGTGACGEDAPNRLAFPGTPAMVIVYKGAFSVRASYHGFYNGFFWTDGCTESSVNADNTVASVKFSRDNDSLSWYSKDSAAQLNSEGEVYNFFALYD